MSLSSRSLTVSQLLIVDPVMGGKPPSHSDIAVASKATSESRKVVQENLDSKLIR